MTGDRYPLRPPISEPPVGGETLWLANIRIRLLGTATGETSFEDRGFARTSPERQARLEHIGLVLGHGYNTAIRLADPNRLAAELGTVKPEHAGFAFEGAGMGLAMLDVLTPWRAQRLVRFLATKRGRAHLYMIQVGAGWALARTAPWLAWRLGPLDPLLYWLMYDGLGFHQGYFHPRTSIDQCHVPRSLRGEARAVFDQGLGRSLWFRSGAQVPPIVATIASFPAIRHADLWSGVGLAAAYAGGMSEDELLALRTSAGPHARWLGQGAAFAAEVRDRAANPAPHTDLACRVFCGLAAPAAAAVTRQTAPSVARRDQGAAYRVWREAVATRLPEATT